VKTPVFMPPMMITGISSAQNALPVAQNRSPIGSGSPIGGFRSRSTSRQATISPAPLMSPGTMSEMNSDEIEVLVVTP
jgi:hypothetical protein